MYPQVFKFDKLTLVDDLMLKSVFPAQILFAFFIDENANVPPRTKSPILLDVIPIS